MKWSQPIPAALFLVLAAWLLGAAGCSKRNDPSRHQADADRYFQNREFERAKIEYINVLRLQPTNGFAALGLGKALLAQGQILEAAPAVFWSRRHFTNDIEIREAFIEILGYAGGETNRTLLRGEIEDLLRLDPRNQKAILALAAASRTPEEVVELTQRVDELKAKQGPRAAFELVQAELLRRKGDTNACEVAIRNAIQLEPTNVTAQATLAAYLLSHRRVTEGEAALRRSAELAGPSSPVRERWGRYLLENNRHDEARAVFDEINSKAPERVSAWTARAELAIAERKVDEAERYLGRALGQAPNNPSAIRVRAQIRLAQGKPADAVHELERVVEREGGSARSQYQLGVAYLLNRDTVRATESLEASLQQDPGLIDAVLLLAEISLRRGDADKAVIALRDAIRRDPNNVRAQLQLIRALRAQGRPDDALAAVRVARQAFPTNSSVRFQEGMIFRQLNRPADARGAFEEAVRLAADSRPAFEQIVALDVEAKNYAGALKRVQERIDASPKDPLLWLMKSEIFRVQGDGAQAEASIRKVLELDPENVDALSSLAKLAVAAGKKQEAVAELEKVLQRRPNDVRSLQLTGLFRSELGDYAGAREVYEKVLQIEPSNALILNNLADLLAERFNQLEPARQYAMKARQTLPDDPSIADTLGWIEYRRGQHADALRLLSEAAVKLGDLPEVQYHLGMTHYMMGQESQARAALQQAAGAAKDFPGKTVAREYLAMLEVDSGKVDEQAIRALEKRRQDAPSDMVALTRLGAAYESTGAYEKAREVFEAALKVNAQSVSVLSRLANLYATRLNNPAKAIEIARTARGLAPGDPEIGLALGRLAFRAGDQAWAYTLLQESSRRLTNRPDAAFELAWAAFSQGRLDDAVRAMTPVAAAADPQLAQAGNEFLAMARLATNANPASAEAARIQTVLDRDPDHGVALYAYGRAAEAGGKFESAQKAYEKLLAKYPGYAPATRQLAVLFSERLGDDAKAQEYGTKARQAYPRDDVLAAAFGKALARRGDFGYAAQLLSDVARNRPKDAAVLYHLGLAQEGLKKMSEAKTAYEKALALEPGAAFAEDAKARLEKLK